MKGLKWSGLALLFALGLLVALPHSAAAGDSDQVMTLIKSGGGVTNTTGGNDPGTGDDTEGDPENWLGGQNYVPVPTTTDTNTPKMNTTLFSYAWMQQFVRWISGWFVW